MAFTRPTLGHGIGLRTRHFPRYLEEEVKVDWLEAISENFLAPGGRPLHVLEKVRSERPLVLHGVSLSIGGTDPLNRDYLKQLRGLIGRFQPALVSDHLCWGSRGGHYVHDLLPLPYTEEAVKHVVARVTEVQEALGRQILLENVSSYVAFRDSEMPEWAFLAEIANRADCGILLDVNNIVVSARNHNFQPSEYVAGIPAERVGQIHLAGHSDKGTYLFDDHGAAVPDPVWAVYELALRRCGRVATLVEWDDHVPELEEVLEQAEKARAVEARVLGGGAP